jgi:hypothetical protein
MLAPSLAKVICWVVSRCGSSTCPANAMIDTSWMGDAHDVTGAWHL